MSDPHRVAPKAPRVRKSRRIPFVQQLESSDCGAACVTMLLRWLGRDESLASVRDAMGTTITGVTARMLLGAARRFGLRGRVVRVEPGQEGALPRGAILHWEFNHFVVLDSTERKRLRVIDPANGRRSVSRREWERAFTGIAILLEPSESYEPSGRRGSPVVGYLRKMLQHRGVAARVLFASLFVQLFGAMLPIVTGVLVDRVIPNGDVELLAIVGLASIAAVVFGAIATLARSYALLHLRARVDRTLTLSFVEHLMALPYGFFQRRSMGDLMMRVHANATVRELLSTNGLSAMLDGTMVLVYGLLIAVMSPPIALAVLVLGGVQVALLVLSRQHFSERMSEELYAQARTHSQLAQMLAGVHTLKAAGAEPSMIERWSNRHAAELNAGIRRGRSRAHADAALVLIETLSPLVVLALGGWLVVTGALSLGTMLALAALSAVLLRPLAELVRSGLQLTLVKSYLERLEDVMTAPPETSGAGTGVVRLGGAVSLENVAFRYSADARPALDGVSLDIEPGRTVAIVGPSGSGKSTLASLLLGLFPLEAGSIRFDGRDLRGLPLRELRRSIGFVPQNPYLFDATVRENIALGCPDADLDRIVRAARTACIHGDIVAMMGGYDTRLVDRGESLSGGQRQRIALARALLARPPILVLDEATSALDAATEAQVVRNLSGVGATRIVIAHRLSTVVNADLIVVLVDGRIVEAGRHPELVNRPGPYRDLLAAQLGRSRGQDDAFVR